MQVEIKAIPTGSAGNGNIKMRRASYSDHVSLGGVAAPPRTSYEPTFKDKMCFKAITFMKPYANYSFEELRFSSPIQSRVTETLYGQDMEDGSFTAHWTPNSVGSYCLTVSIDGILLEEVYRVEVKEGSIPPPSHRQSIKKPQPPNKLRTFYTKNTAGLRIRSHPTLQSEQVGIVKLNGIISFIDEIENDDGVWLRLSTESIRQHCTTGWYPTEAWCLQYNQHLNKTLLHPVVEPQTEEVAEQLPVDAEPERNNKSSKGLSKIFIDNADVLLSSVEESPSPKTKSSTSPMKKVVDYSTSLCSSPPKTSSLADTPQLTTTNPFLFPQCEKLVDSSSCETELNKVFEMPSSTCSSQSESQAALTSAADLLSLSSSPSNLGSAIAGVVGGGASKLQALQKWFKGDAPEASSASLSKSNARIQEIGETASVSVKDLVKAMSQDLPKANGNKEEVSEFDVNSMRRTNFSASQTAALLSTPKHSPRKLTSKRIDMDAQNEAEGKKSDITMLENEMSLLQITTNQEGKDQIEVLETTEGNTTASTDNSSPPVWPEPKNDAEKPAIMGPIKRAMPPSLAESVRAVFAAFLWHEGVVHDAMACASFLKFHPNLPKEGAPVVTRRNEQTEGDNSYQLSKEQKAQQRHSVEVANAGNYLNIRPSTLETLTKTGNSCINNRKHRKNLTSEYDKQKLHSLPEVVTILPPALRCLVYLWEQVCTNCIQIVQSNTLERQKSCRSPTQNGEVVVKEKMELSEKETKKQSKKKKKDDGSWCEICEMFLPIPVTYHMRIVHPGCGKSAKGKGYNSVGIFCEGWAGNCGEGGKGASSWFLMCDECREKYISSSKNSTNVNQLPSVTNSGSLKLIGNFRVDINI